MQKLTQLAAEVTPPTLSPSTNVTVDPVTIVTRIINYAFFFLGAIALVFVIWGGVQFILSGGDAEKTTKARNTLLYAVIGIIVVVLAWAIVNWASGSFTGVIAN